MQSFRRVILLNTFRLFDLVAMMVLCVFIQYWVEGRYDELRTFGSLVGASVTLKYLGFIAINLLIWRAIFSGFYLYESFRLASLGTEIKRVLSACALCTTVTLAVGALFGYTWVGLAFGGLFLLFSSVTIVASRLLLRSTLKAIRLRGRNLRHVVIVGTNEKGMEFYRHLQSHPELGYLVQGFVDPEPSPDRENAPYSEKIVSDLANFPAYIRDNVIDEVFIFMPYTSLFEHISTIVAACEEQGIIIRLRADVFNLSVGNLRVERSPDGDLPLLVFYTGRHYGWKVALKRSIDFTLAALGLAALSPFLLAIAIAIRLTSPGPAIFVQERVGLNKRRFNLYKFRTMVEDAEARIGEVEHLNEVEGPVFKLRDDPRITPIGRILRKTSVDELPQLINVLTGDMSLVGPRPLPVRDYNGFDQDWMRRRMSVRPGLTCIWQISGRNDIPFERWMELDMAYIDEWSLWLDVKILFKTIPAIIRTREAY